MTDPVREALYRLLLKRVVPQATEDPNTAAPGVPAPSDPDSAYSTPGMSNANGY